MKLSELEQEFKTRLSIDSFEDISLNGLQVGDRDSDIKKVGFAVDASLQTIKEAIKQGCDLLFVHHGLFWGSPIAITGTHYERVREMIENHLALFACHLPLDAHGYLGNNAQMALRLGMKSFDPFGSYHGKYIGFKGTLPFEMTAEEIAALLNFTPSSGLKILPFGKEKIQTVGIVSGGASSNVKDAIDEHLDAYITGEACHEDYSAVVENNITMIAGGHYKSEVFGVLAVSRMTKAEFGLETCFIDVPTGL